jgi:predicted TIM-barrel fold metal-dependent hydrolase
VPFQINQRGHVLKRFLIRGLIFLLTGSLILWLFWRVWPVNPAISQDQRQTSYLDMHVHVAGLGAQGSGCFISDEMRENIRFPFFLWAMDTSVEQLEKKGDAILITKLSRSVAESRRVGKVVVLAMDGVVDVNGELDLEKTQVYIPNDFVATQTARYDNLRFGASINPLRPDALRRLDAVHARGAVLIKWIPAMMHIDPSDERIIPFYRRLVELGLPLLSHAGQERSFPGARDEFGDPEKLKLPLDLGVTVIAAHIATTGEYDSQDSFERLLPMFERYPNLYSEISSLTQINKLNYLVTALQVPGLKQRLLYGSDWPLQFYPLIHPLYHLPEMGIDDARAISELENAWDRDVALKEALGVPESVFLKSEELLIGKPVQ